ncbi:MAG: quinone oxidoreductase [Chromatiales bacterium]|nr:quinone oxidoreductase [Chromatiales bacterium]
MQIKAIRMHAHGGPEVLRWEEVELVEPGPGSVRVRHHAVGLNYIDVYHRTGQYPTPSLPCTIGMEAAGVVEALGDGVGTLAVGDRVAYATPPLGAYAEARNLAADRLVRLPDCISFETGAAMMLQGMTVEYLLRRTYPLQAGQTVLFHAAAGGVGLIFCQWARQIGATVIGTVGSAQKADLARAHGCTHTILYREENVVERVRELTGGKGVDVVYDGVGKDTWITSLDSLRVRGMMVSFGSSSGKVPPLELADLTSRGSLYLTRPTLMTYTAAPDELQASAAALFGMVDRGIVSIPVNQRYPLAQASDAHRALEARETVGSSVLVV